VERRVAGKNTECPDRDSGQRHDSGGHAKPEENGLDSVGGHSDRRQPLLSNDSTAKYTATTAMTGWPGQS
jgi:hypothetical protein